MIDLDHPNRLEAYPRRSSNSKVRLIENALRYYNRAQAFFVNVKSGPTITGPELSIMDAVALKPSWTKPCITIYEIKTSISDFRNDSKWHAYLEHCHRFYFAAPAGMIKPTDVPDPAGLIVCGARGCRVTKKTPLRPIDIPWTLLYHIVISRLDRDCIQEKKENFWHMWLEDKRDLRDLGGRVGIKLNKTLAELVKREEELREREREIEKTTALKDKLEAIIEPLGLHSWHWDRRLAELVAGKIVFDSSKTLKTIEGRLEEARKLLDLYTKRGDE